MWHARCMLMWLIIEANVVDLPDPVGPVTSTRPWATSVISAMTAGTPRSAKVGISCAMSRNASPRLPR